MTMFDEPDYRTEDDRAALAEQADEDRALAEIARDRVADHGDGLHYATSCSVAWRPYCDCWKGRAAR